jgi:hypothetical protein
MMWLISCVRYGIESRARAVMLSCIVLWLAAQGALMAMAMVLQQESETRNPKVTVMLARAFGVFARSV